MTTIAPSSREVQPLQWWQPTPQRVQRLSWLLVFLTFDLILFGAFTRLTDSGLGCPDWPGCYGNLSPLGARHEITAAQVLMPMGPVTHIKAWIEMIHRYFATALGTLIILKLVWLCAAARRQPRSLRTLERSRSRSALALAFVTFMWVCLQGAFGAFTVTWKLFPLVVSLHLLGGFVLLMLLSLQVELRSQVLVLPAVHRDPSQQQVAANVGGLWGLAFVLLWLQIALGAWVSANYAVVACNDFPSCNGQEPIPSGVDAKAWWEGFTLWRDLGRTGVGHVAPLLGFSALQAIHLTHRAVAGVLVLVMVVFIGRIQKTDHLRSLRYWLIGLLIAQIVTGVANVALSWPLLGALVHTGGAAGLVLIMVFMFRKLRCNPTS